MGLFRPYERPGADSTEPTPNTADTPKTADTPRSAGKATPTPTRREAEAARRERLNPSLSKKELRARERAARSSRRDEQFVKTESTPGKVLMRDFVDAHRGVAQWSMPALMGMLAISLAASSVSTEIAFVVTGFTYSLFLFIALDVFLMWRRYKRLHAERLPNVPLKGLLAYLLNRSINLRRLRLPAPRVKPGDKI